MTRTRNEDQLLEKIFELMVEKAKLQEENAYLWAELQTCTEGV